MDGTALLTRFSYLMDRKGPHNNGRQYQFYSFLLALDFGMGVTIHINAKDMIFVRIHANGVISKPILFDVVYGEIVKILAGPPQSSILFSRQYGSSQNSAFFHGFRSMYFLYKDVIRTAFST